MATQTLDKELMKRLDSIEKIRNDLRKAEKNAAKDIMGVLKELMSTNPLLVALRWQQYTMGFNDGEPCTFDIYGPYFKFADNVVPEDEGDNGDGFIDEYEINRDFFQKKSDIINVDQMKELQKTVKNVQKCFSHLQSMDGELESMFGDGYEITVTAEGVEVEDYSHD